MSSIKQNLRIGIAGVSAMAVATALASFAAPANADFANSGGEIGLVDTDTTANGTQGATLVYPGISGQRLGDVRLLIPNTFKNGDTIDLTIFDRTATNANNGQINADTAHKLGFTAAPTVTVNPTPHIGATSIGPNSTVANNNTERNVTADTSATRATTPPVFTTSVVQSSRANGLATDIIRLTVNGVQAAGDATNEFVVTLSDITADLGPAVSPGELRVVPFAYNGAPSQPGVSASTLFDGNVNDIDGNPATYDPRIRIYTVPAYVAPVNFTVGSPSNVVADGTQQSIGPVTITETNNYSLQNGTYTLNVNGAAVRNNASNPITVTATNAATGETVTSPATVAGNNIGFTLAGASNTSKLTITLNGLLLSSNTKGPITYSLRGGSIDNNGTRSWLRVAGTSGAIGSAAPNGVSADSAFGQALPAVNQTDIQPPLLDTDVKAIATGKAERIGGGDRYETAAKIALNGNTQQQRIVLASGENFPDALSSGYLANQIGGGNILLTKQGKLPKVTADAMRLLGTRTVFVVGGESAVSNKVLQQLRDTPQYYPGGEETYGQGKLQVVRLGGDNRYATNQKVNEYASALSEGANPVGRTSIRFGQSSKLTALVATGESYADALAAGPATSGTVGSPALSGGLPLILTRSGSLTPAASSQMNNLGIQQAVVVGGTDVVSTGVESSIGALGADVYRVSGSDRYSTAAAVADFEIAPVTPTSGTTGGLGFDSGTGDDERAYLATGEDFADALAGAPLAGGSGSPIMLTRSKTLSAPTASWFSAHAATYYDVVALGLGAAVSPAVLQAANDEIAK